MRILVQRVHRASVSVAGAEIAAIGPGLLLFVGFGTGDEPDSPAGRSWPTLLKKVLELRIFPDDQGKLNLGLTDWRDSQGSILAVSQFTLYADCRKGRRPSFHLAADPGLARTLFERAVRDLQALWPGRVASGVFGEEMDVSLVNWGPVTVWLDSEAFPG